MHPLSLCFAKNRFTSLVLLVNNLFSNPVVVENGVATTGVSLLPEAGLQLCSLLPHVLQAAQRLGLDLLVLHGQPVEHAGIAAINAVCTHFVHCLGFLVCQTNTHI